MVPYLSAFLIVFVGAIAWLANRTNHQRDVLNTLVEFEAVLFDLIVQNSWYDVIEQIETIHSYVNREARPFLYYNSSLLQSAGNLDRLFDRAIQGFLERKRTVEEVEEVLSITVRLARERIYASPLSMALLRQRYDQLCELTLVPHHMHGDVN